MAQMAATQYSESQRSELRALILLASEVIADYWPMRTFVHHNPLHGLEYLHFKRPFLGLSDCSRARGICPLTFFATISVRAGFCPINSMPR